MGKLVSDGEAGIVKSKLVRDWLGNLGVKVEERGVGQKGWHIERRGQVLRDQVHRSYTQLLEEGFKDIDFKLLLAECFFAGNALVTIGNSTPYNNVYGRVPRMLPNIDQVEELSGYPKEPNAKPLSYTNRMRELCVSRTLFEPQQVCVSDALSTRAPLCHLSS